ncbi:MAG: sulfotransferase domain-containing protein, partial [Gammaproteobacteria bacterium]
MQTESQTENNEIDPRWGEPSPLHDPVILAHFKARPTDVLITTPPKAGTTWMQQILYQLRSGGDPDFSSIDEVVPWLEIQREGKSWQQILQHFETLPEPRIFKTHCTAEQTPGIGIAKIILTSRDPRDCCVSFYHHLMNMTDEARSNKEIPRPTSFDEHVEQWLEFAAWYRNVKSWWPYYDHPKVLWLRYQDMKNDIESSIDQITAFLDWKISDEQKQKVLEYSSFDWMKTHDEKFSNQGANDQGENKTQVFKHGKFIRQGKVGKYRELMSDEQEQRVLEKAKNMLEPECLRFLELG